VNQKYQEEPESIIIRRSTSGVRNFLCNDRQRGKSRVSAVSARGENKQKHVRGKEGKREMYLLQVSLVNTGIVQNDVAKAMNRMECVK